jgi:hypothetical protein
VRRTGDKSVAATDVGRGHVIGHEARRSRQVEIVENYLWAKLWWLWVRRETGTSKAVGLALGMAAVM